MITKTTLFQTFVSCLLLFPFTATAQKKLWKRSEIYPDSALYQTRKTELYSSAQTLLSLHYERSGLALYAVVSGYAPGSVTVLDSNRIVFVSPKKDSLTLYASGAQAYTVGRNGNNFSHLYRLSENDLAFLKNNTIDRIRKFGFRGQSLFIIRSKGSRKLLKLSRAVNYPHSPNPVQQVKAPKPPKSKEREKKVVQDKKRKEPATSSVKPNPAPDIKLTPPSTVASSALRTVSLDEVANHVGDSVNVCGRISSTRYMRTSKTKPVLLNMGAAFPAQKLTLVIYEKDQPLFVPQPDIYYQGKTVCVSGRIVLYNGKPQIALTQAAQLKEQ